VAIDYAQQIPNNVNLDSNPRLQRALEAWRPRFLDWWRELGPSDTQSMEVFLRTAMSVDARGWANFGYVKMPDYRWGIFLAKPEEERKIAFGAHKGAPVWQEVPGEYRASLRRLIVTQGDTEPASVEQQRFLGRSCPSLYDLRNLFQVNVEEGRHLWAMVYLLHAHFGRDGREEAEAMLERHAGDQDRPRILGAFNEQTPDWLSYFLFTFFTDRDGKYQLAALAESGFDPLSRTCRFMLTEEAHHMFVGETGVMRIVQRTSELMKECETADVRPFGVIDLPTLQKYINFHYSVSLDLFGQEISTNAANYYTLGLKGRLDEPEIEDDHLLDGAVYRVPTVEAGSIRSREVPALTALNERLRDDYIRDCTRGMMRWNKVIERQGISFELKLPHRGFNRGIGEFAGVGVTPEGDVIGTAEWTRRREEWLPSTEDRAFVQSLMAASVVEPGRMANWIAPPARGIDGRSAEFEYVRFG
jgi:benzoyl-CoA 2,3-epoxidase subunit B